MTTEEALKIVGNQPVWAIRNMRIALTMHSWLNSEEENRRLEACKIIERMRKSYDQQQLAVTAKECDKQQQECVKIANHIAFNMSKFEVERAKKEALQRFKAERSV